MDGWHRCCVLIEIGIGLGIGIVIEIRIEIRIEIETAIEATEHNDAYDNRTDTVAVVDWRRLVLVALRHELSSARTRQ